ncbi:hypothetical protein B484DRAFT_411338, partial [Ochromonadaceae sp. CCMP2298]
MTISHRRAAASALGHGVLGDLSQKGNWLPFRNELFNGKPINLSTNFASPMPKSGHLEFDFVSAQRYTADDFVLNDARFTNMLVRLFQIRASDRGTAMVRLSNSREDSDKTLQGNAKTVYECSRDRAAEIGETMATFYDNLAQRQGQIERYRQKEGIKVKMDVDPKTVLTYKNVHLVLEVKALVALPREQAQAAREQVAGEEGEEDEEQGEGGEAEGGMEKTKDETPDVPVSDQQE